MQSFEDLNDRIVYTKVKSRNAALNLKDDAAETATGGKTVVIFFENRYLLHLAPGQDPYQVRKDINSWQNKKDSTDSETTDTKTTSSKTTEIKSSRPRLR